MAQLAPILSLTSPGDEHARALEEQWIEGGLTADTATSASLYPLY